MSDDMKRLLKGSAAVAVVLLLIGSIYFGWSSFRASRERMAREASEKSSKFIPPGVSAEEAESWLWAPPQSQAPAQSMPGAPASKVLALHHLSFSPDGRFLVAAAQYQTTAELVVWPSSGGATLLRKKYDLTNSIDVDWKDKNHLFVQNQVLYILKGKGYWAAEEMPRTPQPGGSTRVDSSRSFPRQDVLLRIENDTVSGGNGARTGNRLAAYSLATGASLSLPPELESQTRLQSLQPLTRWGKAPLRLAQWNSQNAPKGYDDESRSDLEVWDARAKKRLWKKTFKSYAGELLVGEAGKFIIVVGTPFRLPPLPPDPPGTERYFNGKRVTTLPQNEVHYATDGIEVYEAIGGKLLAKTRLEHMRDRSAIVSPDGTLLAFNIHVSDRKFQGLRDYISIHHARTLRPLRKIALTPSMNISGMSFSPDNSRLAVADSATVHLYSWRGADVSGKTPFKAAWF